mmetsp:Transcript_136546/g.424232  ORF Transcript_136546/g.424232 Transcript_136546/m.424232 type:complete len:200 (+) Transcript_136546:530-1129(+)
MAAAPLLLAAVQASNSCLRLARSRARRRRSNAPLRRRYSPMGPPTLCGRTTMLPKPSTPALGSSSARAAPGSSRRRMRPKCRSAWYRRPCSSRKRCTAARLAELLWRRKRYNRSTSSLTISAKASTCCRKSWSICKAKRHVTVMTTAWSLTCRRTDAATPAPASLLSMVRTISCTARPPLPMKADPQRGGKETWRVLWC